MPPFFISSALMMELRAGIGSSFIIGEMAELVVALGNEKLAYPISAEAAREHGLGRLLGGGV